jgi:quinol-cytochrome oxidoreductase complex cytochrome b subunit
MTDFTPQNPNGYPTQNPNGYIPQDPTGYPTPTTQKRPAWKTVLGIILVVFGGLAFLGMLNSAPAIMQASAGKGDAYVMGLLFGRVLVIGITFIPGILLLRSKK